MRRNILALLSFFAGIWSFAATGSADSLATVMGTVSRRFGETTLYLEGASVRLYSECDTLSRQTDYFGGFTFTGIKPGTVRIAVTYIGCEPVSGSYDITGGTNMVYFQLEKAADTLRTAVVTAERNLFRRSGDTLKVDTRALSTLPDAYAMDLLKQVPGIEISNGKVMAFGKKVERTYVNGVQIFGDGTLAAFRNIRADEVKGIDIYDESSAISDYRGEQAAEKETVLDIKTKDPIVSAVRAAAVATGGADETPDEAGKVRMRYDLEAKADFFSEMLLLGARGGADNLEREVMQYGSPVAGGDVRPLTSNRNHGGLNLNFQKFWKDRRLGNSIRADAIADLSSDRRFSRTETDRLQENNRISSRTSDTVSLNYGTSTYIASFQGTFMRTPVKSIITNHNFTYTTDDNLSERRALEMSDAGIMRYGGTDDERKKAVHYGGRVIWQDYDLEKITPRAEVSVHYDRNDGLSMIVDTAAMSAQPRNLEGKIKWEKTDVTANLGTDFTVRNDETRIRKVSCMYEFGFAADNSEKFSWDLLSEPGKRIEMASGTYSYSQNLFTNSLTARYAADSKDFHLDAGLVASYINQKDNNNMADGRFFKYNWFSVCPEIRVSYKRRLRFDLSTSSEAPSADRLRAVLDYSNPFNLMGGNPSLKQSYTCKTGMSYSTLPTKKGLSFRAGFETTVTANPIVNSVKYFSSETVLEEYGGYVAPAGAWLMSYSNGNVALRSLLGGGFSSRLLRICTLSANVYYNFSKSPQSQPGSIIDLYTHGPSARLSARIDWNRKISFTANYNFSGMFDYRLREAVSTRFKNNVDVSATWFFYKRNSVNVCYSGAFQNYAFGSGSDVSLHTLSAYVDIPIIPRKLSVRLTASDLLDRSDPFTETVTATYRTSEWKASFGRYYLASIIWNFELNRNNVTFMGN